MPRNGITVQEARRRFARWQADALPGVLTQAGRSGATRIGARAVSTYMRDGAGDEGSYSTFRRTRAHTRNGRVFTSRVVRTGQVFGARPEGGPLRRLSGKLARALRVGAKGNIARVVPVGTSRARLEFGVDLAAVPYARIHEKGGTVKNGFGKGIKITIPARPYLAPAIDDERGWIAKRTLGMASGSLRRALRGLPAATAGGEG